MPGVSPTAMFNLSITDLNEIKALPDLAVSNDTTFIAVGADLIVDINDNRVVSVSSNNALQVSEYTGDVNRPSLEFFNLELDEGILTLSFDETVNVSSLDISALVLQDASSSPLSDYTLNDSYIMQGHSSEVNVTLSFEDLNQIKDMRDLCSSDAADDCFLTFPDSTVLDMTGLQVYTVSGEEVNVFVNDTTSPSLSQFAEIDLRLGTLTLVFSETIAFETFNPQHITLQNLFEPPHEQLNLTGGNFTELTHYSVQVELSMPDLSSLKRDSDICTYRGNCYITASTELLQDIAGNSFAGVPLTEPGVIVREYIRDDLQPQLESFDLDLNSNQLKLVFDEPIDIDTLDVTRLTLQAESSVSLPLEEHTLTDGNAYSLDAITIMVNLSLEDANVIKARDFATSEDNTYLTIAAAAVYDLASPANPIATLTPGQQVDNYTQDSTPPMLRGFTLDLQGDELTLTFNEPVRVSSFNFTGITIKSNCTGGSNFTLTDGSFNPANLQDGVTEVSIVLTGEDLIAIKSDVMLATDTDNTYLSVTDTTVEDMSAQRLLEVACLFTVVVTPDTVRLQLRSFDVDLHTGSFNLTFDDVVDSLTWNPRAILFQSDFTYIEGLTYRLTSGSTTNSPNGYTISVSISDTDLLGLKSIEGLATDENNTYITMQASAIDDTLGNDVLAITNTKGLKVRNYYADSTPPALTFSALDLDSGFLNLTFDDFPNATTFDFNQVELRNMANGATSVLPLSPTNINVSTDGFTLSLPLNITDLNEIKLRTNLASDASNAYISIDSTAFVDLAGNPVSEIPRTQAHLIDNYTADGTGPEIVRYSLDVNASSLVLTFSETIDASTLNLSAIVLQDAENVSNAEGLYRLTGGTPTTADGTEISITFSEDDIFGLQEQTTLLRDASSTFLAIDSTLIMDTNMNSAK